MRCLGLERRACPQVLSCVFQHAASAQLRLEEEFLETYCVWQLGAPVSWLLPASAFAWHCWTWEAAQWKELLVSKKKGFGSWCWGHPAPYLPLQLVRLAQSPPDNRLGMIHRIGQCLQTYIDELSVQHAQGELPQCRSLARRLCLALHQCLHQTLVEHLGLCSGLSGLVTGLQALFQPCSINFLAQSYPDMFHSCHV